MFQKSADASVDVLPLVPLWLSGLFSGDVREHALPDLPGGSWSRVAPGGHQALLDVPGPVGLDVYGRDGPGLGGAVQLRFLWAYADVALVGDIRDDFI